MANSQGSDRKPPPAPVKIHHFDKRAPRPEPGREGGSFAPTVPEMRSVAEHPTLLEMRSAAEHPTLPEMRLVPPRFGGAAIEPSPLAPLPKTEPPPPASRAEPPPPAAKAEPPPPASKAEPAPAARSAERRAARKPRAPAAGSTAAAPRAPASAEAEPPPGSVAERLAAARRLIEGDNLEEARTILERLVTMGVATGPVHTQLGAIYMAQGSTERALEHFEEALSRDSMDLMARVCRGEARLWRGDLRLAQEDLQRVLEAGTAGSPLVQRAQQLLQRIDEQRDRKRR
jgi:hypothetical protein